MALFNYATKEITLKIVYYGPGLSGKTTNLQHLHAVLNPETKGKLLSLSTEADRTLFFDFLPVELGKIKDFSIRFQLYTVPGQVRYNATRRVVLKGADAVVFVADSQRAMKEQNIESFENMRENLRANNINPEAIPVLLQYNKRDLKNIMTVDELNEDLNPQGACEAIEASAIDGTGVDESFKLITRLLLKDIARKHKIEVQPPTGETISSAEPEKPEPTVIPGPPTAQWTMPAPPPEPEIVDAASGEDGTEADAVPSYEISEAEVGIAEDIFFEPTFGEAPAEEMQADASFPAESPPDEPSESGIFPGLGDAGQEDLTPVIELPDEETADLPDAVFEVPSPQETAAAAIRTAEPEQTVSETRTVEIREVPVYDAEKIDRLAESIRDISGLIERMNANLSEVRSQVTSLKHEMSALQLSVKGLKEARREQMPETDSQDSKELKELRREQREVLSSVREAVERLKAMREKKRWFGF